MFGSPQEEFRVVGGAAEHHRAGQQQEHHAGHVVLRSVKQDTSKISEQTRREMVQASEVKTTAGSARDWQAAYCEVITAKKTPAGSTGNTGGGLTCHPRLAIT